MIRNELRRFLHLPQPPADFYDEDFFNGHEFVNNLPQELPGGK